MVLKNEVDGVKKTKNKDYPVKKTLPIRFSDKVGKDVIIFDFKKIFGFLPEKIILQKVLGQKNLIVLCAVLTDEELKKEEEQRKATLMAQTPIKE